MSLVLYWSTAFIISVALLFTRSKLVTWAAAMSVLSLALLTLMPTTPWNAIAAGITMAMVALISFAPLRRLLISGPVMRIMAMSAPRISQTERDALEAGTVWWDAELFNGRPDWQKLLDIPVTDLSAEERAFIDGPVNHLCDMLDDWSITHEEHDLPERVWEFIRQQGFFGMIIPKEYGGLGFSALAHSTVVMKLASRSVTAAVTVMVPNSLGPAELLLRYGTDEQRQHYLPRLAAGKEIPCFALTEPNAGSDAASLTARGVVCRDKYRGKSVLGIRLNWEKRYITLGPVATLLGLAFRLYDPEHLLGDKQDIGITLALIDTNTKGVAIGERHFPLNLVRTILKSQV